MALTDAIDVAGRKPASYNAFGWFNLGADFVRENDNASAVAAYRHGAAFVEDPIHASGCYMNLAWILIDRLALEEAQQASWRGVALRPESSNVMRIHARNLRACGNTEDAIRFYTAALEADPEGCRTHWTDIALLRTAQGRYLEALDVVRAHVGDYSEHSLEYKIMLEVSDICLTAYNHEAAPITSAFRCPSRDEASAQWQAFYAECEAFRRHAPVICIGDSHAAFFSGLHTFQYIWPEPSPQWLPHVSGHYIASSLAFSLNRRNTTERGLEKLEAFLSSKDLVRGSSVMLSFGEIDLRNHVIGQSIAQNRPVEEIVGDCVESYRTAVERVLAAGHRAMIWAPPASRPDGAAYGHMFPTTGNEVERNAATRSFIQAMRAAMAPIGVPVISIFDEMISENLRTDGRYFMDSCHLNMAATPLAIAAMRRGLEAELG